MKIHFPETRADVPGTIMQNSKGSHIGHRKTKQVLGSTRAPVVVTIMQKSKGSRNGHRKASIGQDHSCMHQQCPACPHLADLRGHRVRELAHEAGHEANAPGLLCACRQCCCRTSDACQTGAPYTPLHDTGCQCLSTRLHAGWASPLAKWPHMLHGGNSMSRPPENPFTSVLLEPRQASALHGKPADALMQSGKIVESSHNIAPPGTGLCNPLLLLLCQLDLSHLHDSNTHYLETSRS